MGERFALVRLLDEKDSPKMSAFRDRYCAHLQAEGRCKGSIYNAYYALTEFVKFSSDPKLHDVDTATADSWQLELVKRLAANTARLRLIILRSALKYAMKLRLIERNPMDQVSIPKQHFAGKVIPDHILRRILRGLPRSNRYKFGLVHRIVRLLLHSGMRKSEGVLLDRQEIRNHSAYLPPARTKNRRGRPVPLNDKALRAIGPGGARGRVFDVSPGYVNSVVNKTCDRLGIPRIRLHDLRHTAATRFYERNHDDHALMKIFGWSNPYSVLPYHHISDGRTRKTMDRLSFAI